MIRVVMQVYKDIRKLVLSLHYRTKSRVLVIDKRLNT